MRDACAAASIDAPLLLDVVQAKGLEFSEVIIVDFVADLLNLRPGPRSSSASSSTLSARRRRSIVAVVVGVLQLPQLQAPAIVGITLLVVLG